MRGRELYPLVKNYYLKRKKEEEEMFLDKRDYTEHPPRRVNLLKKKGTSEISTCTYL